MAGGRRHVDDRPAARSRHQRHRIFAAKEHPFGHDGIGLAELFESCFFRVGKHDHAGVVDQYVEPAELRLGCGNRLFPRSFGRYIMGNGNCPGSDLGSNRLGRREVDVADHNRGTLGCQKQAISLAQSRASARNQSDFARYSSHCQTLRLSAFNGLGAGIGCLSKQKQS